MKFKGRDDAFIGERGTRRRITLGLSCIIDILRGDFAENAGSRRQVYDRKAGTARIEEML